MLLLRMREWEQKRRVLQLLLPASSGQSGIDSSLRFWGNNQENQNLPFRLAGILPESKIQVNVFVAFLWRPPSSW